VSSAAAYRKIYRFPSAVRTLKYSAVGILPPVLDRYDLIRLVVELEAQRSLVGFVAGLRVDVDRNRHSESVA